MSKDVVDRVMPIVDDYLNKGDHSNENANMMWSPNGLLFSVGTESLKVDYLERINRAGFGELAELHELGGVHIHDLSMGYTTPYCCGHSLFNLLQEGIKSGTITSKPAKHFRSAINHIVNYIGAAANEYAGAQAFSDIDLYLAPYAYKCFLDLLNDTDDINLAKTLAEKEVRQSIQELIFHLNYNTRYGGQPPFSNITLAITVPSDMKNKPAMIGGKLLNYWYDTNAEKYESYNKEERMFTVVAETDEDSLDYFILGQFKTNPTYGELQEWQSLVTEAIIDTFLQGDASGKGFTFPVLTINVTNEFFENPIRHKIYELAAKYGTPYFQNFINGVSGRQRINPDDVRSMCPLAGKEYILIKSNRYSFPELCQIQSLTLGSSYDVYSDGKYVTGKFNKFENKKMMKITLSNGHTLTTTTDHENFVSDNDNNEFTSTTDNLKPGMYLPYSLNVFDGHGSNYDLGYIIGCYAGDGSVDVDRVVFSLNNVGKKKVIESLIEKIQNIFGTPYSIQYGEKDSDLVSLCFHSQALATLCQEFVPDKKTNKYYSSRIYSLSKEFRRGILDGHYDTDGGNKERIYTSSEKMVVSLNMLASSLGLVTSVNEDNRAGRYSENTNYCVRLYKLTNDRYGDVWFKNNGKVWFKIEKIEEVSGSVGYCFEIENGDPMFTVATTGILTHNCRLQINEKMINKHVGGIFGNAEQTGSIQVVTLSLPYIAMEVKDKLGKYIENFDARCSIDDDLKNMLVDNFIIRLESIMNQIKEEQLWKRAIVEEFFEKGFFPMSKSNFKRGFDAFYTTIGFVGLWEAVQILTDSENSFLEDEGMELAKSILSFMADTIEGFINETHKLFNLEATPAESASYKLAKKAIKRFPDVPYRGVEKTPYFTNSCHIPVELQNRLDLIFMTQSELQTIPSGGTVTHFYTGEEMSPEEVETVVKVVCETPIPYFSVTTVYSVCPIHGYIPGAHEFCPYDHSEDDLKGIDSKYIVVDNSSATE